ncbi:hypothetical protein [Pseudodonghicola flavimaris]|uniref:Tetratricopeptide repeat protein n=1 Tax=Pseudodonghicola flavimaris TaxID=3050036 RepID=A0ABT7EWK6_9RHOB|nr:hypothetical protein [Pseudodonghicola flavimaris]MDK3016723.1 hypothetical protein [Pseudodonghicola flavimaris]
MKKPMALGGAGLVVLLMGGLVAGPARPSGAPEGDGLAMPPLAARPEPGVGAITVLNLTRWPQQRFHEQLSQRIDALSTAHGPERPGVLLDMAEMFLAQMMLYEAGSVLDGVEPQGVRDRRRWRAMRDATDLLSGQAVTDLAESPLSDPARPDRGLWQVLQAIAAGEAGRLRDNLTALPGALAAQPRAVRRALLPGLAEAAIEAGDQAVVAEMLMMVAELPDLSTGPVGAFLRGRSAELTGRASSALEAYFDAARGWDRYAARARLGLAGMALENGGTGALLAARDVLEHGADAWRGDRYELEVLQRLAEVYGRIGDNVGALLVLGKLMLHFPDTPEAEVAAEQARGDLAAVYGDGAEGRLPLAKWLSVHLQLVPLYRYFPDFALQTEVLADRALEIGGTDLATVEYRRALALTAELAEGAEASEAAELAAHAPRLQLKLAGALARGGQLAEARAVLTQIDGSPDPMLRQEANALKSRILAELGETAEVLRTHVPAPAAQDLRNVARALWQGENWLEAVQFYRRLWTDFPQDFGARDASYLLLAARRTGDERTAAMVIEAFPDLTASASWIEIAQSLMEQPAPIAPLSEDSAAQRLDSLERALGTISDTGL